MFPESRRLFVYIIRSVSFRKMETRFPVLVEMKHPAVKIEVLILFHSMNYPLGNFLSREYCIYPQIDVIVISLLSTN